MLNSNIVLNTAKDFATYKMVNKILCKDRQDITIEACKSSLFSKRLAKIENRFGGYNQE